MQAYGEVEFWLQSFVTSVLDGVSGQHHVPAALPPTPVGKRPLYPLNSRPGRMLWGRDFCPCRESKQDSSDIQRDISLCDSQPCIII
jgi:hypothetical protein